MSLKKIELYRGFNIYTEERQAGAWGISVVEVPSGDAADVIRTPNQGRVPGEFRSKETALEAARAHIDRIQKNRKNRASQGAG
jgi:hypothetical protein